MRTDNAADIRLGAALENCIFYISPMYEFLHSLDPERALDAQKNQTQRTHMFFNRRRFMHVLIAILLCIVIGPSWAEEAIITDGDTLILNGNLYRLDGIDAPETDQVCLDDKRNVWACGLEARDQLRKFVGKRDVRCDRKGYDTVYRNRRIGVCWVEGETTSLNADSDDCGQAIRLNAATRSDRRRPPFPMKATGLDCRHDDLGQGFLAASRLARLSGDLSHAVSAEYEAVCVVDETVKNGVGDGGIGDDLVPVIDRDLAGDDGRAALMAVVDDLEEIATLVGGERSESPVVEDEQFDPR